MTRADTTVNVKHTTRRRLSSYKTIFKRYGVTSVDGLINLALDNLHVKSRPGESKYLTDTAVCSGTAAAPKPSPPFNLEAVQK